MILHSFVADARRLNVAVTRAKRHCAIFADVDTFTDARARAPAVTSLVKHAASKGKHFSALEIEALDHESSDHQAGPSYLGRSTTTASASSSLPVPTLNEEPSEPVSSATAPPSAPADPTIEVVATQSEESGTLGTTAGAASTVATPQGAPELDKSSFSPTAFLEASGCGDLSVGSTFLMHRPTKGFVVDVSVRCRNQQALVKTCVEEPVRCFRRRVVLAFGLAQSFDSMPHDDTEAAYRLVCKGGWEVVYLLQMKSAFYHCRV